MAHRASCPDWEQIIVNLFNSIQVWTYLPDTVESTIGVYISIEELD